MKQPNVSLTNHYLATAVSVVVAVVSATGRVVVSTETTVVSTVETSASVPLVLHEANTKTDIATIAKNTFFAATGAEEFSRKSQRNGQKRPKSETFHTFYKI